jgi:hypothetical protein
MPGTSATCRAASLPSGLTRGTDVKDAEWIAELVCCGLIRPSFVPPKPLRELLRYRRKLTEAQAAERNRLQKQLEMPTPGSSARGQARWAASPPTCSAYPAGRSCGR